MTEESESLRRLAQKCFRLSRSINDPCAIATLEEFARELEQRASELEKRP
jgi:hypothetical protein